jgi:hypothetical protein
VMQREREEWGFVTPTPLPSCVICSCGGFKKDSSTRFFPLFMNEPHLFKSRFLFLYV